MTDNPEELLAQQKANCIFCKIIAKEIPSQVVFEDDKFIAIMDIRPATKGHVLLMPKEHYPILPVIPQDVSQDMFVVAKKLMKAVEDAALTKNASLFIANGGVAGQQSPHFLIHIMPRESGDNLPLENVNVQTSDEDAKKVKGALQARFKSPAASPSPQPSAQASSSAEESSGDPIEDLANALEANPEVKKMIIENPAKFKDYVKANPQLNALFQNIDIDQLSERMKQMSHISKEAKIDKEKPEKKEKKESEGEKKENKDDSGLEPKAKPTSMSTGETVEGGADLDKISKLF